MYQLEYVSEVSQGNSSTKGAVFGRVAAPLHYLTKTFQWTGDPVPPFNGYIEAYTSTTEGARVNLVHLCTDGQRAIEELVCTADGVLGGTLQQM